MELDILSNQPAKTEVGSYFVANYPPFSAWSADHVPATLDMLRSPVNDGPAWRNGRHGGTTATENVRHGGTDATENVRPGGTDATDRNPSILQSSNPSASLHPSTPPPLGLYMHIPFCRKRCKFCYFRVYTGKNASDVDTYMDALANEVALYASMERLQGRQFDFVYFGGGTPSFLSSQQLTKLIDNINEHWRWDAAREVTFECEPGTLQKGKLETIKKIGVTRLSLGVEHFDDELLESNGRAHKSKEIYRAYEWIKEVGFPQVNIDLIAGMVGETDDKWKYAVDEALKFEPDSVTIYQMELPHNAVFSKEQKESGATLVATWAQKRAWVDYAFQQFEAAGYVVSSGYTLLKPSERAKFVYRDALWHGADMVGTGVASFSHVGGIHYQNLDQWDDYIPTVNRGELPISRALPISHKQALIREFILQMKLGHVKTGYFREKFDVDVTTEFHDELKSLTDANVATVTDKSVTLTRNGLLMVDELLHRFFEPQFQGVRYT
ncbi:MAG: coproporphyrinogen-III oxidase family protein [Phycisphaerae bacterium]